MVMPGDFSIPKKEKCIGCGKRATKLCDIVTGQARWAGHPPRSATGGVHNPEALMEWNTTCDKPICDKCTTHLNEHMDICPDCVKEIKSKIPKGR